MSDYRAEVNRLIADIDAATDRDSQLVEARIKTLKGLLEDTDRRVAVYLRELQRSREGEALYASLGRGIQAALDSRPAETIAAAETGNPSVPAKKRVGKKRQHPRDDEHPVRDDEHPVRDDEAAPLEHPPAPPVKLNTRAQIAQMSAQGLSPAEIASGMGISLAEVDLALNLLYRSRE